jgi:hypothetical protein
MCNFTQNVTIAKKKHLKCSKTYMLHKGKIIKWSMLLSKPSKLESPRQAKLYARRKHLFTGNMTLNRILNS